MMLGMLGWVLATVSLVVALAAWFVPLGSASDDYGFSFDCPTAFEYVRGTARTADMFDGSADAQRFLAETIWDYCPQTFVALGVAVLATIGSVALFAGSGIVLVVRALANKSRGSPRGPRSREPGVAHPTSG